MDDFITTRAMADLSFTETRNAMNTKINTGHDKFNVSNIWELAHTNNKKKLVVTHRRSGDERYFTGC